MANILKNIIPGILVAATAAIYYTTPENSRCAIKKLTVCDTDGGKMTSILSISPRLSAGLSQLVKTCRAADPHRGGEL